MRWRARQSVARSNHARGQAALLVSLQVCTLGLCADWLEARVCLSLGVPARHRAQCERGPAHGQRQHLRRLKMPKIDYAVDTRITACRTERWLQHSFRRVSAQLGHRSTFFGCWYHCSCGPCLRACQCCLLLDMPGTTTASISSTRPCTDVASCWSQADFAVPHVHPGVASIARFATHSILAQQVQPLI